MLPSIFLPLSSQFHLVFFSYVHSFFLQRLCLLDLASSFLCFPFCSSLSNSSSSFLFSSNLLLKCSNLYSIIPLFYLIIPLFYSKIQFFHSKVSAFLFFFHFIFMVFPFQFFNSFFLSPSYPPTSLLSFSRFFHPSSHVSSILPHIPSNLPRFHDSQRDTWLHSSSALIVIHMCCSLSHPSLTHTNGFFKFFSFQKFKSHQ